MNSHELLHDVMAVHDAGHDIGQCACQTFPQVSTTDGFAEAIADLQTVADAILRSTPPDRLVEVTGHFFTLVMAFGYAMGADMALDTLASVSDVNVPDDLSSLPGLESPALGDRPDDN